MANNSESKRPSRVFSICSSQRINNNRNSLDIIESFEEIDQFSFNKLEKQGGPITNYIDDFRKLLLTTFILFIQSILIITMEIIQLLNSCLTVIYFPGIISGLITLSGAAFSAIILRYRFLLFNKLILRVLLSVHVTIMMCFITNILLFLILLPTKMSNCNSLNQLSISISPISNLLLGVPSSFISSFIYWTIYKTNIPTTN